VPNETFEIKLTVRVRSKIEYLNEGLLIDVLEKKTIEVEVGVSSSDIPIFLGEKRVDKAKLALTGDIIRDGGYYLQYYNELTLHAKAPSSLGVYYITFFVKKGDAILASRLMKVYVYDYVTLLIKLIDKDGKPVDLPISSRNLITPFSTLLGKNRIFVEE